MNDATKDMCLHEELDTAYRLIVAGFGDLQEIDMANEFYHLPLQSLASGLERLMKCYICAITKARCGSYPDFERIRKYRHYLTELSKDIREGYFETCNDRLLECELAFLSEDKVLEALIGVLSQFGDRARYYNLDVVTGARKPSGNPKSEWERIETWLEDPAPYLQNTTALIRDYYPRVHSRIIAKLERLVRAIVLQFTRGRYETAVRQYFVSFSSFLWLSDDKLGTTDYRRSVKRLQQERKKWVKRNEMELRQGRWPTQVVERAEFAGDWPFRADRIVLECREGMRCFVNIDGYDYALNGLAASHSAAPYPHDVGEAILGKSVGPFIEMARRLAVDTQTKC